MRRRRQKQLEEEKNVEVNVEPEDKEEENLKYPDECRVMDIMKDKYIDAIAFFDQSTAEKDKDQVYIAVKEFQMFRSIYHDRMQKYLEFDPDEIEDEVYQRLSENTKKALSNQDVLKELAIINVRRASRILECDEMNRLNFQMF